MSQYTVWKYPVSPFWYVEQANGATIASPLTEAEARIIAWALNAVAENRPLHAPDPTGDRTTLVYDGPTEGVAP